MAVNVAKLKNMAPPKGMDFHVSKVGHVVLQVTDLEVSIEFYTKVLGLKVSDVYPDFEGRRHAGCQIAVEFRDPDNHSLEIDRGVDQVGSDGRDRSASEWRGVRSLEEAIANPVPGQDTHLPR